MQDGPAVGHLAHNQGVMGSNPIPAIRGLAQIVYREVDKGGFTTHRCRNTVNPNKTDIPKAQKALFHIGKEDKSYVEIKS